MLAKVIIPASIFQLIVTHGLSTEKEEIIGMLIGHWKDISSSNPFIKSSTVAIVESVSFLTRSDKRKDRVEIAPEQQGLAVLQAEEASAHAGYPMNVIGWYHSHPHITISPSHIDLRTQNAQQSLHDGFFGLILSCFHTNLDQSQRIQLTCFQSEVLDNGETKQVRIPLEVVPDARVQASVRYDFCRLPARMFEENKKEYEQAAGFMTDSRWKDTHGKDSLPQAMTRLHNSGVYGQVVARLVDNVICPATHLLELKAKSISEELKRLERRKKELLDERKRHVLIEL